MIADLKAGENVLAFFVLRKKEIRTKRDSGEPYLTLELVDASGRIFASIWDNFQETQVGVKPGDVVKVKGKVIELHGRHHINIEKIRKAVPGDKYNREQLLPVVDKDRSELFASLDKLVASVENPYLKKLLQSIFDDQSIRERFGNAPGGKLWHHNYLGGLLEHTLSVTEISLRVGQLYPDVDRDLLLAAGLLHDIGKISAYSYDALIDFTDEGRLIGHIVIGANLVSERIKRISDFPEELQKRLLHLILSHQGKLEQASPVVPMMLEAIILYYADELDSKANAFLRIAKKEKPHGRWSSYVKLMERYFYFGEKPSIDE